MIKLKMDITYEGKVESVTAGTREFIDLEEKYDVGINDFQENPKVTYLCYIAYRTLWWQRKFTGSWEEFLEANPDVDMTETGEALPKDPQEASPAPVSLSPITQVDSPTQKSEI